MSASVLKFKLKKEVELDKNLQPIEEPCISLYANCDSVSSWVADVKTYEEAKELVQPENLDNLLNKSLSCDELDIFFAALAIHPEYKFYDETYVSD